MIENMDKVIDYAIKTKRFIGGLGKLKKDGSIVKINGQILKRKTNKAGEEMLLIDNFLGKKRKNSNKRWQWVLVNNIIALNENSWQHTKVA